MTTIRSRRHRAFGVVTAVAMTATVALTASPAAADDHDDVTRFAGPDRYATAVDVARELHELTLDDNADRGYDEDYGLTKLVIASGESFADGLSAAGLLGYFDAGNWNFLGNHRRCVGMRSGVEVPMACQSALLLTRSNSLPPVVGDFIDEIGIAADDIVIVGGTSAVSSSVADQIAVAAGWDPDGDTDNPVVRIAGDDRYLTAAAVVEWMLEDAGGQLPAQFRTVIVATGRDFADALASGPLAYSKPHPILLSPGPTLGPAATAAIVELDADKAYVIGGEAALSSQVEADLEALSVTWERAAGSNRFATAIAVAELYAEAWNESSFDGVFMVNAFNFADALSAAPLTAWNWFSPILLTATGQLDPFTSAWIVDNGDDLQLGVIVGGDAAVSQAVQAQLESMISG